jgi:hypothetical protein
MNNRTVFQIGQLRSTCSQSSNTPSSQSRAATISIHVATCFIRSAMDQPWVNRGITRGGLTRQFHTQSGDDLA